MAEEILIVDDDTRLSAMLVDYLSGNGFAARTAATAHAGLAELARNPPDVVILDVICRISTASRPAGASAPPPTCRC